jgi:uncharacterized protein with HEPN domain
VQVVHKYAIQGQTEFQNNELIQVWVVHHLQIIGEAANSLSQELITQHSRVPWSQIIAFRNILVHQ